ncbi:MAG: ABC transporter permease [Bacteroidales bacterium]|nr:ABC transporter permease [Bacteroidales bacterium]
MFDRDRWQEIWSVLKKNKFRTLLTAFGVFWGIFMLIIMVGSGKGLQNGAMEGMGNFATNSVFMWTQRTTMPYKGLPRNRRWTYTNEDIPVLRENIPELKYLAPRLQGGGYRSGDNVVRGDKSGAFNVYGDYPQWNKIDPVRILAGRFLNEIDIDESRKVAAIGTQVRDVLFKNGEDPIGQYIRIQGLYFKVVGVFEPINSNINFGGDKVRSIHIPFSTMQRAYNYGNNVGWFAMTAKDQYKAELIERKAMQILKKRHDVAPEDDQAVGHFNIGTEFDKMKGLFNGIKGLIWIVGIGTLLAGVIGISNIMLIIVKERTKEIGIQRAIGAPPKTVITQIISESVFLTTLAGYFGLVAGVFIIEMLATGMQQSSGSDNMFRNPEVDFTVAISALGVLIISGILAGILPARRAVKVKPIDALRYE